VSDGLLDRLGLGSLAGFAIGVAVASNPGEQRPLREFGREVLSECLRLLEDPRLAAALPASTTAMPLPAPESLSTAAAESGETRPRRRRRTRAEIEAEAAAAATAPPNPSAMEEGPPPGRRGRRPRQAPAPVEGRGMVGLPAR
jgi:hypothetical protein